jgi:PAS domain S-box-containing protein
MSLANIMVVEDEEIVAHDLQNRLKRLGYGVPAIASSGEEAVKKAAETRPDLVLMDIVLKGTMDGIEAADMIWQRFQIPILYLTAYADENTLQRAKLTGPHGYLLKPFSEGALRSNIEVALYRRQSERKLWETERWLSSMLGCIGTAVVTTDLEGSITSLNPAVEVLTGQKKEDALGKNLSEVVRFLDKETRTLDEDMVSRVLRERQVVELRGRRIIVSEDGAEILVDSCAAPIRDDAGNIAGIMLVFGDATRSAEAGRSASGTTWRIELLGGLRATHGDQVITHFRTQKTGALLAYLAYHRDRAHPRSVLMELLWPEDRLEAARTSLSVALSSLRRQLLEPAAPAVTEAQSHVSDPAAAASTGRVILADHATVQMNPTAVTTDVAEFGAAFERAVQTVGVAERARWLAQAVELYRGELLPGYFDAWVLQERQWLAERYFQALGQLLAHLEAEREFGRALLYGQRGVSVDPLREEAHQDLMRLYAAAGQPDAALRQYQELKRILKQELNVPPTAKTRTFAVDLERRQLAALRSAFAAEAEGGSPGQRLASEGSGSPSETESESGSIRFVLLYKRDSQPDERLLKLLETRLTGYGHQVFVDRHLAIGVEWARQIERELRSADAVIPLLSEAALPSEMLAYEIQVAHEAAQVQNGKPRLLPLRVNYSGPMPEPLAAILDPLEYALWQGPQDDDRLVERLVNALPGRPGAAYGARRSIEMPSPLTSGGPQAASPGRELPAPSAAFPGGVVPLDSPFYVIRPTDAEFRKAIERRDSIILIKGARQVGKTSLLARGLQHAREAGAHVVLTDFQVLDAADLTSVERLFPSLAGWIADQLDLEVLPHQTWKPHLGASVNFERYLSREVLERLDTPLVWGLDEVDRLFFQECGGQMFGLFRSWHNRRGLDPSGPWSQLTLAMTYATEAHLFITDVNQSPFNVGTRLALADFSPALVADLNQRYRAPLRDEGEVARLHHLLNGHPYLVNRGLWELATSGQGLDAFEAQADQDEGIFGDHLRRILVLLVKVPELCEVVRDVLRGGPCPTGDSFYRLRSAGVFTGNSPQEARPRCQLYATYLRRHLV